METKIHERSQVMRELEIKVQEQELKLAFDEAYKDLRPKIALPGFRPGKAPIGLIKKMHGDAVEGDTLEKMAQEKFQEIAKEQNINPIGMPVVTDLHRHPGEGAHFKISYEIAPEIKLQDFSGMEVEKNILPITDEDVEDRLRRLQFVRAEKSDTNAIDDEQTVVKVDMQELTPEAGKDPGKSEGIEIYLADPEILPEIKSALLGKKVGDSVIVDLPKRPRNTEEEKTPELGKVELNVLSAQKVKLAELTEEFIDSISRGKLKTAEDLRKDMKEELIKSSEERSNEELEESIVEQLLKKHEFEVPRSITRAILDQMLEEAHEANTRRGYPVTYGLDENEFRKNKWAIAEARGKWVLLRDKLLDEEKIDATDEDLEALAEKEAAQYGLSKENLLGYYKKNESIKNRIISDKLGTRLREKVKIIEKHVERKP